MKNLKTSPQINPKTLHTYTHTVQVFTISWLESFVKN